MDFFIYIIKSYVIIIMSLLICFWTNIMTGNTYEVCIYLPQSLQNKYLTSRIFKTFQNKKDAEKWEKRKKQEIESGIFTFVEDKTINEISEEFINYSVKNNKMSITTVSTYKGYIKNFYFPVFKEKKVNQITPIDIKLLKNYLNNSGKSEKTKHNVASFLRSILRFAFDNDYIESSLNEFIPNYSQKMMTTRSFLTINQIKLLINEIEKEDVRDVIIFLIFTGLRISELLGLRFCDIDFVNKLLTVNNQLIYIKDKYELKKPKHDYISSIKLNQISYNILKKYHEIKNPDLFDFVFTDNENKPYRKDGYLKYHLENAITQLKTRNVLEDNQSIGFHSLRHSYGSLLAHYNEGLHNVQSLLRHQNFIVTYKHYVHEYPDYKPESFNKIENDFKELLN